MKIEKLAEQHRDAFWVIGFLCIILGVGLQSVPDALIIGGVLLVFLSYLLSKPPQSLQELPESIGPDKRIFR